MKGMDRDSEMCRGSLKSDSINKLFFLDGVNIERGVWGRAFHSRTILVN